MSYMEDLHARVSVEVEREGVKKFAKRVFRSPKMIRQFLNDPLSIHVSTLAVLGLELGMPIGDIHVLPLSGVGPCATCGRTREEHGELIPLVGEVEDERSDGEEGREVPE